MTPKQIEHWLIDLGFTYIDQGEFSYWYFERGHVSVSDRLIQKEPSSVEKYLLDSGFKK